MYHRSQERTAKSNLDSGKGGERKGYEKNKHQRFKCQHQGGKTVKKKIRQEEEYRGRLAHAGQNGDESTLAGMGYWEEMVKQDKAQGRKTSSCILEGPSSVTFNYF